MVEDQILQSPSKSLRVTAPPGYRLTNAEWSDECVVAHVQVARATDRCPTCGRDEIRRYGRAPIGIVDAPSGGVRSRLVVGRQRIECLSCRRLSREQLPGVTEGHRYTDRSAAWAAAQFGLRSNVKIAAVLGMSEASVRLLAAEVGLDTRPPRTAPDTVAECSSCLRVFRRRELHVHHDPPSRASPAPTGVILCQDCHIHSAKSWIQPV